MPDAERAAKRQSLPTRPGDRRGLIERARRTHAIPHNEKPRRIAPAGPFISARLKAYSPSPSIR